MCNSLTTLLFLLPLRALKKFPIKTFLNTFSSSHIAELKCVYFAIVIIIFLLHNAAVQHTDKPLSTTTNLEKSKNVKITIGIKLKATFIMICSKHIYKSVKSLTNREKKLILLQFTDRLFSPLSLLGYNGCCVSLDTNTVFCLAGSVYILTSGSIIPTLTGFIHRFALQAGLKKSATGSILLSQLRSLHILTYTFPSIPNNETIITTYRSHCCVLFANKCTRNDAVCLGVRTCD